MSKNKEKSEQTKSKKKKIIIFGALGVIALVGIIYFVLGSTYESTDNAQIEANIVPIKTSVSGYIKTIHFNDNQLVKKGDLLFTIDDVELQTRVAQATATLENAKANLIAARSNEKVSSQNADAATLSSSSTENNIAIAKARLTKIKDDYKRTKNLLDAKAATQAEMDGVKAELEVAQAQYDAAVNQYKASSAQSIGVRSQVSSQQAMISLAEALVRQREAELKLAQTELSYASITAPCDGIVSRRSVEEGQFVITGSPMCNVIDNQHLWIAANFKETQVNKIHVGQKVDVKIDAYPSLKLHGTIDSYVGATGAKFSLLPPDNSTGNFVKIVQRVPLKISLDKLSQNQIKILYPGLSAYVSVHVK